MGVAERLAALKLLEAAKEDRELMRELGITAGLKRAGAENTSRRNRTEKTA